MSGSGDNQFQVTLGPEVVISGDIRYIPVYVDIRYYAQVNAVVKTTRYLTTTNPPGQSNIWVNSNPTGVDISDFTPDSTVYVGNIIGGNSVFTTGNVGIGTTSPASKLHVQDGDIRIYSSTSSNPTIYFGSYNVSTAYPQVSIVQSDAGLYGGNLEFYTKPNGGPSNALSFAMKIDDQQRVGIGTTAPSFKTTISADITKSGDINPGTAQLSLEGATTPGKRMILGYDTNSNGFGFIKAGNYGVTWTSLSLQPDGGNVGIGTTGPAYKLDVSGTIRATGDVIAYSDARVKENVETLDGALDKVMKMRGVSYNKIGEQEKKVGVIAQEILEVLPEVVSQDETGTYSVAYGNIVSVLIEAIKEQQKQIDELKSKLK
jgi:hypothetical protein